MQHLVLGTAAPGSHCSPASRAPFPQTASLTPLVPKATGGGGAIAEFEGVNALGFVTEGVLERDLVPVPEPDKAGPEAVSDPDGGTPLLEAGTPLLEAGTPLLEAGTPLLEAGTPLLEALTTPLLEAATAPLLEAATPELLGAMAPLLLLGTMLEAGTEALRVVVAEKVLLEHW